MHYIFKYNMGLGLGLISIPLALAYLVHDLPGYLSIPFIFSIITGAFLIGVTIWRFYVIRNKPAH